MKIPHDGFVVVADGAKMLFLRNEGDEEHPNLQVERKRSQDNPANSELKANRSGHVGNSGSPGGSSYQDTDFHQLAEDRFASETAALLKKRAFSNDFEKLLIVAPPRTLGELRKHYHGEVEKRLVGEIDKDLTGHPLSEIEKIIAAS